MKKNYFGMETMRITQNYNGKTSHYNHSHGNPADYPIDAAGAGSGQSAYFAPVDMKVTAIKGVGSGATNTIWLVSTEKVQTPTFTDYVFLALTHWNDNDSAIKKHNKVGSIVKAGEIICYEGTDGATANHLHIVCGRGSSDNWVKNNKGSWVITGNSLPPEKVMYINDDFTTCASSGGLVFKSMPKDEGFFPPKGYWGYGDNDERVGKIASFMYKTFPSYTRKEALGNYFGNNLKASITEFQKRCKQEGLYNDIADGNVGNKTYKCLQHFGFVYK